MTRHVASSALTSGVDSLARRTPRFSASFLSLFAFAILTLPQDLALPFVGGVGNVAGLMGLAALLLWLFSTSLGYHDPRQHRNPARTGAFVFLVTYLVAYAVLHMRGTSAASAVASDRWVLQVFAWIGVVVFASDMLRSQDDVRRVLRWLVYGAAACGIVAVVQYQFSIDATSWLRSIAWLQSAETGIAGRGALNRVAGTTVHPIELGVVSAAVLPIAIYVALRDVHHVPSAVRRWLPVALIAFAVPIAISRGGLLSLSAALVVLLLLLPAKQRLGLIAAIPVALFGVLLTARGVLRTLADFASLGSSDPSIQGRLIDFPIVERLLSDSPLVGRGPGGVNSGSLVAIFDNQFFSTVVELGLVGLAGLLAYVGLAALAAIDARRRATDPETREAATAMTASLVAVIAGFGAFDALYFPTVGAVLALLVGVTGAIFRLATSDRGPRVPATTTDPIGPREEDRF